MKRSAMVLSAALIGGSGWLGAEQVLTSTQAPTAIVVAKVGTVVLTEVDMQKELGMSLYNLENRMYQTKRGWIDQKVKGILFDQAAKEAGLSRADWDKREIETSAAAPTEAEIQDFIKRLNPQQAATPDINKKVAEMLSQQKRAQRENDLVQKLQAKTPVEVFLAPPEAPRIDVTYGKNDPVLGPANAPVTIIEFTDFQCPWCKRSQESVQQVKKTYAEKVKFVSRQFPLGMHPRAVPAAIAALCAKEQGKFWEYHDTMFEGSPQLEDANLLTYAEKVGLKKSKFEKCLKDPQIKAQVDQDLADGQRFGVSGTPTFFVNGRQTNFQDLETQIKEELAKTKS